MHCYIKLGTFSLFFMVAIGCKYYPDEDYISPIQPADPKTYNINLTNINNTDTIKLFGTGNFQYTISGSKSSFNEVKVRLGNQLISQGSGTSGFFSIAYPYLKTGIFDLQIELVTRSGTGSLADKIGAETVQVWKKWTVSIYSDLPPSPTTSFEIKNGLLVFKWAPYTAKYFIGYKLKIEHDNKPPEEMNISDPLMTSYTDSLATCNGGTKFTVTVINKVGSTTSLSSRGAENMDLSVSYNKEDSTVTLKIQPPKLYANFGHYVVRENNVDRMITGDITTTKFSFKLNSVGYGYTRDLSVERFSSLPGRLTNSSYSTINTSIVTKKFFNPVDKYFFNSDLNALFGYRKIAGQQRAQLIRFNAKTLTPVDSVEIFDGPSFDIPYRGEFAYYSNDKRIVQLNLNTKAERTYAPFTIGSGPSGITAASNQSVSYRWFEPGAAPNSILSHFEIYNMATAAKILTQNVTTTGLSNIPGPSYLSDDGNFYRSYSKGFFDVDPTPLGIGASAVTSNTWMGFREDNSDEFLARNGSVITVYDVSTFTLKRTYSMPSNFLCYDAGSHKLIYNDLSERFGKVWTIDIDNGKKESYNVNIQNFNFIVANGMIITQAGEYFKIY